MALLPFLTSGLATEDTFQEQSQKANTKHKWGMGHADSLLQSLFTHIPGFTPYIAFIPQSVTTTRSFFHDTTMSCLLLDSGSDAVAAHDDNSTDDSLLPARPVDVRRLQPRKQHDSIAHCEHTKTNNETMKLPD